MTTEKTEGRPHPGAAPIITEATNVSLSRGDDIAAGGTRSTTREGDGSSEGWRRSEWMHDLRSHRRISRELDHVCGVALVATADVAHLKVRELREILRRLEAEERAADTADYWSDSGMTLGMPERRAAGLALLGRAA